MSEWAPVRDYRAEREDVVRGMRVVGWLIVLYAVLAVVSSVDEHCTRRMNALRQPVPVRTER